jgi:hypothetical protein
MDKTKGAWLVLLALLCLAFSLVPIGGADLQARRHLHLTEETYEALEIHFLVYAFCEVDSA